jgi:hypothetical protein
MEGITPFRLRKGGRLPTRLGASPVLAGLVPAIHAAPPQRRVQAAPRMVAMASETTLFRPYRPLPSFSTPKRVGSRDKPGHDAFFCRRRSFPNSAFPRPTANIVRAAVLALKALAVGGLLPTRLGASPVLAGLVPAIHAAPPQRRVQAAPRVVATASETTLFRPYRPLPSFSAPKRVGSRDKPGHDASARLAPPQHAEFLLPTGNAIRAPIFLVLNKNRCYDARQWESRPTTIGRRPRVGVTDRFATSPHNPSREFSRRRNFLFFSAVTH